MLMTSSDKTNDLKKEIRLSWSSSISPACGALRS
jgi:hypothetical protein